MQIIAIQASDDTGNRIGDAALVREPFNVVISQGFCDLRSLSKKLGFERIQVSGLDMNINDARLRLSCQHLECGDPSCGRRPKRIHDVGAAKNHRGHFLVLTNLDDIVIRYGSQ